MTIPSPYSIVRELYQKFHQHFLFQHFNISHDAQLIYKHFLPILTQVYILLPSSASIYSQASASAFSTRRILYHISASIRNSNTIGCRRRPPPYGTRDELDIHIIYYLTILTGSILSAPRTSATLLRLLRALAILEHSLSFGSASLQHSP
ncbi:hypothetical protein NMY22_g8816 [Coprinellus aureogranulatus]|nr:hypothetical protein NMY22_g8816 [Coprinellus aureogranulatus]